MGVRHAERMEDLARDIVIAITTVGAAGLFALMGWAGHQH